MKISPVGMPTVPNTPNTAMPSIKMAVNRTVLRESIPGDSVVQALEEKKPEDKPEEATATTETPVEEKPIAVSDASEQANEPREATRSLSPELAELAKMRRSLQVKEREIAEREKALETNQSSSRTELEAKLKARPWATLQELGITGDFLTQDILNANNGVNPEIAELKAQVESYKAQIDKTLEQRDQQQTEAVLRTIADEIDELIAQGTDFETIRETQSQEKVLRHIYDTYKTTGRVLDTTEALKIIEEQERAKEKAKLSKLTWVKGELTPPQELQPQPTPKDEGIKTLTNKDSARPGMSRRQRAIAAMLGQK